MEDAAQSTLDAVPSLIDGTVIGAGTIAPDRSWFVANTNAHAFQFNTVNAHANGKVRLAAAGVDGDMFISYTNEEEMMAAERGWVLIGEAKQQNGSLVGIWGPPAPAPEPEPTGVAEDGAKNYPEGGSF